MTQHENSVVMCNYAVNNIQAEKLDLILFFFSF